MAVTRRLRAEVAFATGLVLGEGPVWDDRTGTLVVVDIDGCAVHRLDPSTGSGSSFTTPGRPGVAVLTTGDDLLIVAERSFLRCSADGSGLRTVAELAAGDGVRLNDGAVDPWGRFVAGTMDLGYTQPIGGLYRLGPDGAVEQLLDDVVLSNGLEWTPDRRTMYYADSGTLRIDAFDLGPDGELRERRPFVSFDDGTPGGPDGLTVDTDGCVWVACWPRSQVQRYTPAGVLDTVVDVPVRATTSVAFGGDDLADLYVTTARSRHDGEVVAEDHAGDVFVVRPGAQGLPPARYVSTSV